MSMKIGVDSGSKVKSLDAETHRKVHGNSVKNKLCRQRLRSSSSSFKDAVA